MRVGKRAAQSLWLAGTIAVVWACGGSTEMGAVCAPGATETCSGPGTCTGTRVCNDDGSAWGACDCGSGTGGSAGSAQASGGTPRVCLAGVLRTCVGPSDCAGVQACNEDGTAYDACQCASGVAGAGTAVGGTGGIIIVPTGGTGGVGGTGGAQIPPFGPVCGDGNVNQPGEQCDDGNTLPGDGCTGLCQIEPNWECPPPGGPCGLVVLCGDGEMAAGEACDDGNTLPGDGCAGDCQSIEPGFYCPVVGEPCIEFIDPCGGDTPPASCTPSTTDLDPHCGDAIVQPERGEECDAGAGNNISPYGPGCGPGCLRPPSCGDGVVEMEFGERCDDGVNDNEYGGCTPSCQIGPYCGDGKLHAEAGEECDDGINDGGYGECAPGCAFGPRCGDGIVQADYEDCDDGNNQNGDGCSSACRIDFSDYD